MFISNPYLNFVSTLTFPFPTTSNRQNGQECECPLQKTLATRCSLYANTCASQSPRASDGIFDCLFGCRACELVHLAAALLTPHGFVRSHLCFFPQSYPRPTRLLCLLLTSLPLDFTYHRLSPPIHGWTFLSLPNKAEPLQTSSRGLVQDLH